MPAFMQKQTFAAPRGNPTNLDSDLFHTDFLFFIWFPRSMIAPGRITANANIWVVAQKNRSVFITAELIRRQFAVNSTSSEVSILCYLGYAFLNLKRVAIKIWFSLTISRFVPSDYVLQASNSQNVCNFAL